MIARLLVQNVVWFGAMGAVPFLAAGTFAWPGASIFLALMVAVGLGLGLDLSRRDPALLRERMSSPVQRGQPAADRMLLFALFATLFAWLAVMGLDRRFGWSSVPAPVQALGALTIIGAVWFCYRAMLENSFAAPVVKIQRDRGQRVVSTGPYAFVRHPMYFGAIFYFIGVALMLGSWWGLLFGLVPMGLLCLRIPIEEKALSEGLDGYDAYAARVRYRLIPYVW